jgi:hypothetical protein
LLKPTSVNGNPLFKAVLISLLLCSVLVNKSLAAPKHGRQTVQQFNNWLVPSANIRFHKYAGLYIEGQLRFNRFIYNQQHQFRTGIEIHVNEQISFMPVAYVYTWNFQYGEFPMAITENEHRMFEQLFFKFKSGRVNWNNRFRMEQRWIEHNIANAEGRVYRQGWTYKNRFRYRLLANIPLNKPTMRAKTIFLSFWDEFFISFGKHVTYYLPDQNRAYAGLGYKFNKNGTINLGYMHQLLISRNGERAESNHTLFVGFNYDFDLRNLRKK